MGGTQGEVPDPQQTLLGSSVLDVACGNGVGFDLLISSGARRVVGVDVAEDALRNARQRLQRDTVLTLADRLQLAFDDDGFDLITSMETIENAADPSRGHGFKPAARDDSASNRS